jgi:hypothetical protein
LNNVDVYKNIGAALDMDDIGLARRLTESLVPLPEESNLIIPSLDDEDIDHLSRTDFTYCIAQFGDDRYAEFEYPVERAEAMKILGRATPAKLFISNITFEDEIILKTLEIPCNIKQTGTDQYAEFESRESYQEACFQLGRF